MTNISFILKCYFLKFNNIKKIDFNEKYSMVIFNIIILNFFVSDLKLKNAYHFYANC